MDGYSEISSWKKLCGDCKGVLLGFCHPENLPHEALAGECKKLPREKVKREQGSRIVG